jgi:hypothetical protein
MTKPQYDFQQDERAGLIAGMVFKLKADQIGLPVLFDRVVRFWNDQKLGDKWIPGPDLNENTHDDRLPSIGWLLYQCACRERDRHHTWASSFKDDTNITALGGEAALRLDELEKIERSVDTKLACRQVLADPRPSISMVLAECEAQNGRPLLLMDQLVPPDQTWITLAEAVFGVVTGNFTPIESMNDLTEAAPPWMTTEHGDIAARILYEAAYKGKLMFEGSPEGANARQPIDGRMFRGCKSLCWASEGIKFEDGSQWRDVFIKTETLAKWLKPQSTMPKQRRKPVTGPLERALEGLATSRYSGNMKTMFAERRDSELARSLATMPAHKDKWELKALTKAINRFRLARGW